MQDVSSCPDRAAWNRLASGTASADEARSLREHLERCPLCREAAARTVDPGHTLSGPPLSDDQTVAVDEIKEIGGYRVVRKIGQGGMGLVFEAEDVRLRRRVAIKVMRPTLAIDPVARERFLREARAVAAVQHDHVVSIFQVGEHDGMPFLVMPLLPGESLDDRLKRGNRIPLDESVRIAAEAADGLAAAHARGVVHRDIKPANIWLEERGPGQLPRARLLDFGLARGGPGEETLTIEGMIVGTPAYMSPEQAIGQPVDAKTDLYSLGAVLFRMIVGSIPTSASAANDIAANSGIPANLGRLMQQLLDRDPSKRPNSAGEVAQVLKRIGGALGPKKSRRRLGHLLVAAGLLLVATTLFVLWLRGDLLPSSGESPLTTPDRIEPRPPDSGGKNKVVPPSDKSPDLLATQWARKYSRDVHIEDGASRQVSLSPEDPLPTTPFKVVGIDVSGNREFSSSDLAVLEGLKHLDFLILDHCLVDVEGMKHLAGLTTLTKLYLSNTAITNDGLKSLVGLTKLRVLRLPLNDIGDEGLVHLRGLAALDELWLDGTQVTNAGLKQLEGLARLRELQLMGTAVNEAGAMQFRKARPECQVHIGPLDEKFKKLRGK